MARVRHHRERQNGQNRLQQLQSVVAEALWPIACKGITDAGTPGWVAIRAKAHDLREIIGGTTGGELFENGEIELRLRPDETPPQMPPRMRLV